MKCEFHITFTNVHIKNWYVLFRYNKHKWNWSSFTIKLYTQRSTHNNTVKPRGIHCLQQNLLWNVNSSQFVFIFYCSTIVYDHNGYQTKETKSQIGLEIFRSKIKYHEILPFHNKYNVFEILGKHFVNNNTKIHIRYPSPWQVPWSALLYGRIINNSMKYGRKQPMSNNLIQNSHLLSFPKSPLIFTTRMDNK